MKLLRTRYVVMTLRLAAAALLLYWVVSGMKFAELAKLPWRAIAFNFTAAFACVCLQIFLSSYRWRLLLRGQGIELSAFRALSLTFQGNMCSLFMPGGAVGGDILKAAFLTRETAKDSIVEGVTTILLDRIIGMMALFLLTLILAAFCFPRLLQFDPEIRVLALFLLAVCSAGLAAGAFLLFQVLFFRVKLFAFLRDRIDSWTRGRLRRVLNSIEVCRRDWKTLGLTFLLSLLVLHPLLIVAAFLLMHGVLGIFPPWNGSALAIALGNAASAAPVTPGGLGARDKVTEVILRAFGMNDSAAALTPLLYSLTVILAALAGIVFFFSDSFRKPKSAPTE